MIIGLGGRFTPRMSLVTGGYEVDSRNAGSPVSPVAVEVRRRRGRSVGETVGSRNPPPDLGGYGGVPPPDRRLRYAPSGLPGFVDALRRQGFVSSRFHRLKPGLHTSG